ncbi:MAG: nucleotidyl transferase AbiEii/AbiGii toxin family protein [Nitrososphaerales archaeon]
MDRIAQLPSADRGDLFRIASEKKGNTSSRIIEKDFWIVWTLKHLFDLQEFPDLVLRGGTTLAKAYHVTQRFSEDIDLAIERGFFQFDDAEIFNSRTSSQRNTLLGRLERQCRDYIQDTLRPLLLERYQEALGLDNISLETEQGQLTRLIFIYPMSLGEEYDVPGYVSPSISIELSARPSFAPNESRTIRPYAADYFGDEFVQPECVVRVLRAERTFCEKLTMLHKYADRQPAGGERISRHYYDIFMLLNQRSMLTVASSGEMLPATVVYMNAFYHQPSAKYDDIVSGNLRLVPLGERRNRLEADYRLMEEMIFGEIPPLERLLEELERLENIINSRFTASAGIDVEG